MPEYWMIDVEARRLLVDRPAGERASELRDGWYESGALPGFRLIVGWLWQDPLPDANACLAEIMPG